MKKFSIVFAVSLAFATVAWSETGPEICEKEAAENEIVVTGKTTNGPGNFMLCDVSVLKDGREVSKHLVTTYDATKLRNPEFINHDPMSAVSNCASQPFNQKFNKKNFHSEGGKFIDICFRMNNGVEEGKDGYAEFYLASRSKKDYFKFDYLNLGQPLKLNGNQEASAVLGDYQLSAKCRNKMLHKDDQFWADIRKSQVGY